MKTLASILVAIMASGCVDSLTTTTGDEVSKGEADEATGDSPGATCGHTARGRAFGISSTGLVAIPATPDSAQANPDVLLELPLGPVTDGAFEVEHGSAITLEQASASARSEINNLVLAVGGITVSASTLHVRAASSATIDGESHSSAGSYVQNLIVNGTTYANVRDRLVIPVTVGGVAIGEVRVLDSFDDGAFVVEGLRVRELVAGHDIAISHAETFVRYKKCAQ